MIVYYSLERDHFEKSQMDIKRRESPLKSSEDRPTAKVKDIMNLKQRYV